MILAMMLSALALILCLIGLWRIESDHDKPKSPQPSRPCLCCKSLRCDVARAVANGVSYDDRTPADDVGALLFHAKYLLAQERRGRR